MDNAGFLPEEDKTSLTGGDQNRKDLDPNENEIMQDGPNITQSPNKQEITAIIHPVPAEIMKEPKKTDNDKSEESLSTSGHHEESNNNVQQTKSKTAPSITEDGSSTIDHGTQTSDEKPVRSNSLKNGHSVHNETIHKDSRHNGCIAPEKSKEEIEQTGAEEEPDEHLYTSDSRISIPEAETLASNRKSPWYYVLFVIFFLGFFLALTMGLIFGREEEN